MKRPVSPSAFTLIELSKTVRKGFTLIELLVVVTIIVVLLALLVPAMDRAIYQTELALCATNLHALSTGVLGYTFDNKKFYPNRPSREKNGSNRPIDMYYRKDEQNRATRDDRLIMQKCFSLNKTLNCPLTKWIDIEGSDPDTTSLSPYGLYFGFQYIMPGQPEKGMFKLGNRLTWDGDSFNVLASDWDSLYVDSNLTYATHPEPGADGAMSPYYYQDADYTINTGTSTVVKATLSYWIWTDGLRGPIDTNYAFDDGSVLRFNAVTWDEGDPAEPGAHRLLWIPQSDSNNQLNWKFRMPPLP